jgi:hypothetical protein
MHAELQYTVLLRRMTQVLINAPAVPVQPADVEAPLLPAAEQSDAMQVDDSVADASTSGLYSNQCTTIVVTKAQQLL